jgi:hypothetical protein
MALWKWTPVAACIAVPVAVMFAARSEGVGATPPQSRHDDPAVHNMLIVGEETVYLSHLSMFQEADAQPMPHRYQVVLEASLAKQEGYVRDRRDHAATIYMLSPAPFVLPALAPTEPSSEPTSSFDARVVTRGHLEREGAFTILRDVEVRVERVLHFREFDPQAEKPPHLEYLLFGKGSELFMTHLITAPPDFDQVVAVRLTGDELNNVELERGIPVAFSETTNSAAGRLRTREMHVGEVISGGQPTSRRVEIELDAELYFEEGELRIPPVFAPTPEEKKAGFP